MNIVKIVLALVAAVVSFALAARLGANFLIPAAAVGIVWVVAWNLAPDRFRPMVPAFAVQAGHGLWIVFGLIYLRRFDLSAIDFFLLAGGLVWLWLRPGGPPAIFLAAFQLLSLGFNLYLFQAMPDGSFEASALAVHILLRILAVALLIFGVRLLRKSAA